MNACSCLTLILACIVYWQAREISRLAAAPDFPFDPDLLRHVTSTPQRPDWQGGRGHVSGTPTNPPNDARALHPRRFPPSSALGGPSACVAGSSNLPGCVGPPVDKC